MRNFNSQEGILKPILRIKITPEGLSILNSEYKNVRLGSGRSDGRLPHCLGFDNPPRGCLHRVPLWAPCRPSPQNGLIQVKKWNIEFQVVWV